ncbi:hypothetical protein GYMLUDRAFT_246922 [Collybiopsis luxurians FD-317 M1]|uniref:Uncharacterized protein n=1 Tax=Collybiopsis luxurians FD-317 M1 TaxID=944289 RepID=A0A0D0B310_9AGAR|nr:hypothetical protein GYMLUDRAFT_246922 [Collybiopsis luxurians FD-317 M1]
MGLTLPAPRPARKLKSLTAFVSVLVYLYSTHDSTTASGCGLPSPPVFTLGARRGLHSRPAVPSREPTLPEPCICLSGWLRSEDYGIK